MVLNRRAWRAIRGNIGRSVGVVTLIFLGSFYFVAAGGIGNQLEANVTAFAEASQQEDVSFTADGAVQDIARLERESGARIEAIHQLDTEAAGGEMRVLSESTTVNAPVVLSGRGLDAPGEVLLDPHFLADHGLSIGDRIEVNGTDLEVVGTAGVGNYVYVLKNLNDVLPTAGFGFGIVSPSDFASVSNGADDVQTSYAARFADRANVDDQVRALRQLVGPATAISSWTVADRNLRISLPQGNISSLQTMSLPVATVFFLLGGLIVGVLATRSVRSDRVVIGALYALGYRRSELTRHYLATPVILTATGGLLGAVLAVPCIGPVIDSMMSAYILPDPGPTVPWTSIALAVALPSAVVAIATLVATRRLLRTTAVDLMRGAEPYTKVGAIERRLPLGQLRFATRFRIREQLRSIPRLVFMVLGVSVASAVLLFGFTFDASMDTVSEQGTLSRYAYPLEYNFTKTQNLGSRSLPAGAEPYNAIRVSPEGRESVQSYLIGTQPDSVGFTIDDADGAPLPRDQVNISAPLAQRLGLEPGDALAVVDVLDGARYSLTIDGVFSTYGEQVIYMPLAEFNSMTGQPEGSYRTVLSNQEIDVDPAALSGVLDTRDPSAFDDLAVPTDVIVTSIAAVAALMAVVIIYLVTSLMIEENRNSISLMKVLGYPNREIGKLVLNSSTPAVVLSALLGVPLVIAFGSVLYGYLADVLDMLLPIVVLPWQVLVGFVIILAVYEITKRVSRRKLSRIPMSEALKAGAE